MSRCMYELIGRHMKWKGQHVFMHIRDRLQRDTRSGKTQYCVPHEAVRERPPLDHDCKDTALHFLSRLETVVLDAFANNTQATLVGFCADCRYNGSLWRL